MKLKHYVKGAFVGRAVKVNTTELCLSAMQTAVVYATILTLCGYRVATITSLSLILIRTDYDYEYDV